MATQPDAPRLSTLQQERSRETRRRLIQAAQQLWRTQGFDETTVSEVCDEAGVSKGTFYFYFARKEDLLLELALTTSERVWEDWQRLAGSDMPTDELVGEIVDVIARRTSRTPKPLLERTVRELLASAGRWFQIRGERNDFQSMFREAFARAQQRGEIHEAYDARELADMETILVLQAMLVWARGRSDESLANLLRRRTMVLLLGAVAPPAHC